MKTKILLIFALRTSNFSLFQREKYHTFGHKAWYTFRYPHTSQVTTVKQPAWNRKNCARVYTQKCLHYYFTHTRHSLLSTSQWKYEPPVRQIDKINSKNKGKILRMSNNCCKVVLILRETRRRILRISLNDWMNFFQNQLEGIFLKQ